MTLTVMSSMGQNQIRDYVDYNKHNPLKLTPLSTFVMGWYGVKYKLGGSTKSGIDRNTDHFLFDFFLYDLFATDMY